MPRFLTNRYFMFFVPAAVYCLTDLATKSWFFHRLGMPGGRTLWVIKGVFGFQTTLNQGAVFGILQGQVGLFALLSIFAVCGVLYWLIFSPTSRNRYLLFTLSMILAGILGNLYDRLGLHGLVDVNGEKVYAVRDWILFKFGQFHWPNFNIADSLLVCGAALLAYFFFQEERAHKLQAAGHAEKAHSG